MNRREFIEAGFALTAASGTYPLLEPAAAAAQATTTRPGRSVTLDAKPEKVSIDLATTAILVIDMQNDFGSKGGMFERAGIDTAGIQRAVPPTAKVLAAGRKAGIPIVYIKMAFKPDLSDIGPHDSPNYIGHHMVNVGMSVKSPTGADSRILIRDTWNTAVLDELKPEPSDIQLYKHRFSGFFETDLDATLKRMGIRSLVVTGCTTSVCVESTIRDAMFRDYRPVLLADCSAEVVGADQCRTNHEASLLVVEGRFGWISTSAEFVRAVGGQA